MLPKCWNNVLFSDIHSKISLDFELEAIDFSWLFWLQKFYSARIYIFFAPRLPFSNDVGYIFTLWEDIWEEILHFQTSSWERHVAINAILTTNCCGFSQMRIPTLSTKKASGATKLSQELVCKWRISSQISSKSVKMYPSSYENGHRGAKKM